MSLNECYLKHHEASDATRYQFSGWSFSFQMADDQGHIVEQGPEDPENNDTVDAKPDRSSFVSSIFR